MTRLIDADALLKDIRDHSRSYFEDDFAKEWVNRQPTIYPEPPKTGKWIPCKKKLPDKDGEYLVTFEKGYAEDYCLSDIGIAPFEVDCEGFGIWQEHFHPVSLGSLGSEWVEIPVTAWMPLPEPYKEDENGTVN